MFAWWQRSVDLLMLCECFFFKLFERCLIIWVFLVIFICRFLLNSCGVWKLLLQVSFRLIFCVGLKCRLRWGLKMVCFIRLCLLSFFFSKMFQIFVFYLFCKNVVVFWVFCEMFRWRQPFLFFSLLLRYFIFVVRLVGINQSFLNEQRQCFFI